MTETQQTMTEFTYATGETDVIGDRFSPSVVLFWLKTSVAASNMRVMYLWGSCSSCSRPRTWRTR